MENNINTSFRHGSNCFDLLRHAAAYMVLFSHHFALSGFSEPKIFDSTTSLGGFAVIVFFSISGYLITGSLLNSKSLKSYFIKRIFRIFPGLIVCSLVMTVFIFPFYGLNQTPVAWLGSLNSIKSFVYFSFFGSPGAGDLVNGFTSNYIFQDSANGSLWSLKFEFFDYIAIAVIFLFFKKNLTASISFLLLSFAALMINNTFHISDYYLYRTATYSIPFAIGALLYSTKHVWINSRKYRAFMRLC